MLERALGDQLLWAVAFALYALEAVTPLRRGEIDLQEDAGLRLVAELPQFPYEILGRELRWSGLLMPWTASFIARFDSDTVGSELPVTSVQSRQRAYHPFRVIAGASFLLGFVGGPVITAQAGISFAIAVVAPALYALALVAGILLWLHRRRLAITDGRALWMGAEGLICPPLLAALPRRLSRLSVLKNASSLVHDLLGSDEMRTRFRIALQNRGIEWAGDRSP